MQIFSTQQFGADEILKRIRVKRSQREQVELPVKNILEMVKNKGDEALYEYTKKFDGAELTSLRVEKDEIRQAYLWVAPNIISALKQAKANIEKFQSQSIRWKEKSVETTPGVKLWREFRPIESVGLYVPGGKATYPSTVLMLAIPAQLAGCKNIVMCTPPSPDGSCNPAVLVAADLCGVTQIFKIGGAQAIAAMAYGTKSVPKVFKIFGPGNQYVTTAKMLVYGEVDIDMPAGPSELLIIADETAKPSWIAADLLSQLEHGEDSQSILITTSRTYAKKVVQEMMKQLLVLPRKNIIQKSLQNSTVVIASSLEEICEITNLYAPEHLGIACRYIQKILAKIMNAGSIFLGKYSTEPLGDYATGANHTLPTAGFAAMFSPLSPESFGKMVQIQKVSKQGARGLQKTVETLAQAEGLDAHKNAVTIRFV